MIRNTLTTYGIAQYAQVTPRTVIQWINEGKLKAFRTPGNHSRVTIQDFLDFCHKYNMPVPQELLSKSMEDTKRILVVDDDHGIVDAIRRCLVRDKVYDLAVAYDGFEAGEKFAAFRPHLIILDIRMPGLDGYKVCSRIRSNPENKNVKILFISGTIDKDTIAQITKLGADGYLTKPFSVKVLKDKLQTLFGHNRRAEDRSKSERENV